MPLTLITGPANAGKAGRVLDAYLAALDREPLLVVPRFEDVARYQRELAGRGAVFGGGVLRFAWLWREIALRAGTSAALAGPLLRRRLLEAAIARAELRAMAGSAAAPGYAPALLRLIDELQGEAIGPADLAAALEGERAQARELGAVYSAYRAALDRAGRVDEAGLARAALAGLRATPERWRATPVFLYGFDDFTGLELQAIEALAADVGADVTAALTFEDDHPAFAGRARTALRLRSLAVTEERLPARAEYYLPAARTALHHVERTLFSSGSPARIDPGEAVALHEAGGERSEIELAAAAALDLLRAGVPAPEIAVVLRDPEDQAELVAGVFAAYGVPAAVALRLPLARTALGRALIGILRCALAEGTSDELIAYLRAPGLLREPQAVDRVEADLRRAGERTALRARERWEADHPDLDELDQLARAARDGIAPLAEAAAARARWLLTAPHRGGAPRLEREEREDAAAYAAAAAVLQELATLGSVAGVPPPGPADVIAALEEATAQLPPVEPGGVVVTDPRAVRARRFRAVFALGLGEGQFPRPPRSDPFLTEDELVAVGLRRGDPEARLDDERLLFYAVASRPSERLVLSFSGCDEEGRPLTRSPFVDEVRALLSEDLWEQRRVRRLHEPAWPAETAPTARELARARAATGERVPERPLDAPTGAAAAELAAIEVLSPGSLETFADCPIKWLVERWLRPTALAPEEQWLARGSYAHDVLRGTLDRLAEARGSAALDPSTLPDALAALDATAAELGVPAALGGSEAAAAGAARRVERDVRRLLERDAAAGGSLVPTHLELAFGFEEEDPGSLPPLDLASGEVALRLRGRIDRVDVDAATGVALVRDYKVGKANSAYRGAQWAEQRRLQVALYLLAVAAGLGARPVGGVYQPLRARGSEQRARGLLDDAPELAPLLERGVLCQDDVAEDFDADLEAARDTALALAARLRAADLRPCPETCTRDGGCAHPGICRSLP
jgi:ATP-dependent helicase/DNAse subunit B